MDRQVSAAVSVATDRDIEKHAFRGARVATSKAIGNNMNREMKTELMKHNWFATANAIYLTVHDALAAVTSSLAD